MEASLVTRLEAVTSRLEALASKSGGGTSGGAVVDGKVNFVLLQLCYFLCSFKCTKRSNHEIPNTKTVSYGLESIIYVGPKIWKLITDKLKDLESLELYKQKVKSLKFEDCPCKLCKNYIHGVGYID